MTWPDHLPKLCPGCGSPYSEDWVEDWPGWTCGSYQAGHASFHQVTACAILHWKTRALKAEAALDALLRAINRDEILPMPTEMPCTPP